MLIQLLSIYIMPGRCGEKVFSAWYSLNTALVSGWPGPHHSADFCEGLEESSGGQDVFHPSDMEEEVLVQLVRLYLVKKSSILTLIKIQATFAFIYLLPVLHKSLKLICQYVSAHVTH